MTEAEALRQLAEANAKIAVNTRRIRFYAWLIAILTGLNFAVALARLLWGF